MLSWLKRKPSLPPVSAANPGKGAWIRTAFANGERSWVEEANVLDLLADILEKRATPFKRTDERLDLENGLVLRPQFVHLQPREDGKVNTTSTVEVNHPQLCPNGTFEYQHFIGDTTADSLRKGLESWADVDLPVFVDALLPKQECMNMLKDYPASGSSPPKRRQIIFGPPLHMVTLEVRDAGGQHNFCPCCLLMQSIDGFMQPLEGDEFCGIRLFASRDQDGVAQTDCRINGVDWPAGAEALLKYVATWPERGLEYRKQFVAIRTLNPV